MLEEGEKDKGTAKKWLMYLLEKNLFAGTRIRINNVLFFEIYLII